MATTTTTTTTKITPAVKRGAPKPFPVDDELLIDDILNPSKKTRPGPLARDIEDMMFGFGDSWPPDPNAVRLVEALVTEYIQDIGARALQVAELRSNAKLDKECFVYLVRKDRPKFQRVHKLLTTNEELKNIQKVDIKEE